MHLANLRCNYWRSELNELEQQNIGAADRWAFARRRTVLDQGFLRGLFA
jgi:hypothetical protein